jgi:peptide deformylase
VSQRILVLDVPHEDEGPGKRLMKLVNPEIVERDGSIVWEEAVSRCPTSPRR